MLALLKGRAIVGFCTLAGCVRTLGMDFDAAADDIEERDFSFVWVSRCCFMLSARVNFLGQPFHVHDTAFSAVWILECREAWPEVVNVFSQPWVSL